MLRAWASRSRYFPYCGRLFFSLEFSLLQLLEYSKITPTLSISAAYVPFRIKIISMDLNHIIPPHKTDQFIIRGDFNAKHPIWNNLNRNANGSIIKNHSDYQLIVVTTRLYTARRSTRTNCSPTNIDIFLSNIPYSYNCQTIDDLPLNHLPVELSIQLHKTARRIQTTEHTDWKTYTKLCNKININPHLKNEINLEIKAITQHIYKAYKIATQRAYTRGTNLYTKAPSQIHSSSTQ